MRFAAVLFLSLFVVSIFSVDGWLLGRRRRRRTPTCPAAPPRLRHHGFHLNTAKRMWQHSLFAYTTETDKIGGWTCKYCYPEAKLEDVRIHHGRYDTWAFTGYDRGANNFILSFRGSKHLRNWLSNFDIKKTTAGIFSNCGGKLHKGFLNSYEGVQENIKTALRHLKGKHKQVKILYVTGHSRGGSIATIAAPDLRNVLRLDTRVYTFSAPRCGDSTFVDYYKRRIATSWRCYNKGDPIVSLVPSIWPFRYHHVPIGVEMNSQHDESHRGHGTYFGLSKRR